MYSRKFNDIGTQKPLKIMFLLPASCSAMTLAPRCAPKLMELVRVDLHDGR